MIFPAAFLGILEGNGASDAFFDHSDR
jgi:hypothetical protein